MLKPESILWHGRWGQFMFDDRELLVEVENSQEDDKGSDMTPTPESKEDGLETVFPFLAAMKHLQVETDRLAKSMRSERL